MMKKIKYILSTFLVIAVIVSCTIDDINNLDFLDSGVAPSNVAAFVTITQDNTGLVTITPSADGAMQFEIEYGDGTESSATVIAGENSEHIYAEGTYVVNIIAKGITGLTTNFSKDLLVSFQAPVFGSDPVIENDAAVSKQVNVTVGDDAQHAMYFDVYFVEDGAETIVTGNLGETVSYIYADAGLVTIKVVLKGGAIATTEFILNDFEVVEILQPLESASVPKNRDLSDYISLYSSVYADVEGTNFNPDWGQSGLGSGFAEFDLNGDKMLQYTNLSYQGIAIGETIDVSGMEYLHMDVWTAEVTELETSLINGVDGNSTEEPVSINLTADNWTSIDIPISDFTDQGLTVDQIFQFKFVGTPSAEGTIFVDNIYFYRAATVFAELPITFDSTVETFEAVLDAEFSIVNDPEDATNKVGMITNHGQGWGWEGVKLKLDTWVDVSVMPTIKLDFYNDGVSHDVLLKLEDSTSPLDGNGNPTVFEEVHATVSNTGWSELNFDFISEGNYDNIVLFVDGGVYDITGTYYFDNIRQP